jgi:hypothetical protein
MQPDAFLREVAHRRGQDVISRFGWAIRPIYRAHTRRNKLHEHIGTCTRAKDPVLVCSIESLNPTGC